MAPKKRKAVTEEGNEPSPPARVTRSSARKASEPALVAPSPSPAKKKSKVKAEKTPKKAEAENGDAENGVVKTKTSTIIIEHWSFKKRAEEAKTGLEAGLSRIEVLFNPEKPRKGCFEIRADGGKKFITLLGMNRPFKKMKDLDMGKVVEDIVNELK